MDAIELEIGGGWIGSAYSPQVSVTDTEDGHRVEFTYDDAEDGISTVGYDVPDWSDDEEARRDAETARASAEAERSQAESQRAAAESSRASAESSRISAEASREEAEEAREGAEAARQAAFEQAEAQRAAGEQSRAQAESQRVSAETARQEAMAEAVERSQQAAQGADEATQAASQAAQGASDAATRANASATQADQAATRAAASADAADASKAAADQATASANSAATAASDAAQAATTATAATITATGNANTATSNANDAAQSASASATAADAAAESANDASQRAEAAIEAIGDISELAVPLMSSTTRGGATLGHGLTVDGGALSIGDVVTDETDGPIYSVDAKGWAEQDGTPTPDNPVEIKVCRGRNLLPITGTSRTINGVAFTVNDDKSITISGTATANTDFSVVVSPLTVAAGTYTFSATGLIPSVVAITNGGSNNGFPYTELKDTQPSVTSQVTDGTKPFNYFIIRVINGTTVNTTVKLQLELGSTPTPYVPYGHIGLEVRDSSDELVSVTPIPLPAKGFAAALPDGTADSLAIDSAGRCDWESVSDAVDLGTLSWMQSDTRQSGKSRFRTAAVVENITGSELTVSSNVLCSHFPAGSASSTYFNTEGVAVTSEGYIYAYSPTYETDTPAEFKTAMDGVPLYYQLATPTTEHAYIDLPTIPEGATVDIPELREVGVRCFVPGARELIDHANNWGERCKENESRIAALEAAIANLATS